MKLELDPEPIWLLLLHKVRGSPKQSAGKALGSPSVTLETAECESRQCSALVPVLLKSLNVDDPWVAASTLRFATVHTAPCCHPRCSDQLLSANYPDTALLYFSGSKRRGKDPGTLAFIGSRKRKERPEGRELHQAGTLDCCPSPPLPTPPRCTAQCLGQYLA